ncbi:hypothetical protein N656DRAFT_358899 [Canariomyces notabilis]|uniref:Uncharacterized protein n=1 Tax=Canariomyces notabilis TaxID=2074819 RepID=A0AAN6QFC9_9PEZI|nr:hypothetical protein N656DRAFT_358899 [Canariomyces arenarius]
MRVRVYTRIATASVLRVRNTVWVAISLLSSLGGSTKLGSTPGGGGTIPPWDHCEDMASGSQKMASSYEPEEETCKFAQSRKPGWQRRTFLGGGRLFVSAQSDIKRGNKDRQAETQKPGALGSCLGRLRGVARERHVWLAAREDATLLHCRSLRQAVARQ